MQQVAVTDEPIAISQRTRFQVPMVLAIIADALQLILLPLFVGGGRDYPVYASVLGKGRPAR